MPPRDTQLSDRQTRSNSAVNSPRSRKRLAIPQSWIVLGAISLGSVLGGIARYEIALHYHVSNRQYFAWPTWLINVVGCFVLGIVMVLSTEIWRTHRLLRPFLGIGVLGGFTTFSTYIIDIRHAISADAWFSAMAYLFGTVLAALLAMFSGIFLTRLIARRIFIQH